MAEHQGFMLLYTEANKHTTYKFVAPPEDFDKLWERAKAFVGPHHEVDGMSSKPVTTVRGEVHTVSRNTSFGLLHASVERLPIMRE